MRSRSWSKSRVDVKESVPGFMVALWLYKKTDSSTQIHDLSTFLGGRRDQNIPHHPAYPAGSAGYITLAPQMPDLPEIYTFLHEVSAVPESKLSPSADLECDLGITGDDFFELVEQFSREFKVDMSTYRWYFHHGDEVTFNPGALFFKAPNRQVQRIPVTPALLVEATNAGRWPVAYPEHRLTPHRYDILATYALLAVGGLALVVTLLRG
jgi:hypothetical protein